MEANGFAGGIWLFWKSDLVQLEVVAVNFQAITCCIHTKEEVSWFFTALYASPCASAREELWDYIAQLSEVIFTPWCCAPQSASCAVMKKTLFPCLSF